MSEPPPAPRPPERGRGVGATPGDHAGNAPASPDAAGADAPTWEALARAWAGEAGPSHAGPSHADTSNAGAPNDRASDAASDAMSDAADDAHARRWLAAHPDEAARLAALDRIVGATIGPAPADVPPVDVEAALARVTARRLADPEPATRPAAPGRPVAPAWAARPPAPRWSATRRAGTVAAAALLAAGLAFAGRQLLGPGGGPQGPGDPQRHLTAVGQRDSVRLADGTRVLLGPGTTLEVPAEYGHTARTVALAGEAYFTVVHDDARPFTVHAGPAVVRDLGTAFTVRADGAGHVAVTVTEGSVQLMPAADAAPVPPAAQPPAAPRPGRPAPRPADSGLVLRAGERGVVAPDPRRGFAAARASGTGGRAADDTAWTSGRLVFRDAPLPEVAAALRRWYGVELRVADPALAARHLTASFRGEPLPAVLRVVGLALGARLDRQGDTVFVRPPR